MQWFGRSFAFARLIAAFTRIPGWLLSPRASAGARARERAFFRQIVSGFGIAPDIRGKISTVPGTLFVANHISWADIPLLAGLLDADFVAKSDIARWPILGALARRYGPIFVDRSRRHGVRDQAAAIRDRLAHGRSVILFAEGTTTDGSAVLPFRSSLFEAADAARAVQPVALRYLNVDGSPLAPERQRAIAWIGDDGLLGGAGRVAEAPTRASIAFLHEIDMQPGIGRKALADAARRAIVAAYAAAPNRPR
jgi:1-acyl-sn-glycerol-3-phosphate acyltransferase